jgi:hypothetical protein
MGRCPFYKIWLVQDGFCANMYRVLFIDGQMSRLLQFRVPRRRKGASKARHLPEQTVGLCQSIALKVFLLIVPGPFVSMRVCVCGTCVAKLLQKLRSVW